MTFEEEKSILESSLWKWHGKTIYKFTILSTLHGVLTGHMDDTTHATQYTFELGEHGIFRFKGTNPFAGEGRVFKIQFETNVICLMLQAIGTADLDPYPIKLEKV